MLRKRVYHLQDSWFFKWFNDLQFAVVCVSKSVIEKNSGALRNAEANTKNSAKMNEHVQLQMTVSRAIDVCFSNHCFVSCKCAEKTMRHSNSRLYSTLACDIFIFTALAVIFLKCTQHVKVRSVSVMLATEYVRCAIGRFPICVA